LNIIQEGSTGNKKQQKKKRVVKNLAHHFASDIDFSAGRET